MVPPIPFFDWIPKMTTFLEILETETAKPGSYSTTTDATGTGSVRVADDYAASVSTYGSVSVGGSQTGNIEINGDNDWFATSRLSAGTTYSVSLRGASSGGGTLVDPVIDSIRDFSGISIANTYSDDGGTGYDSLVSFTPATSGYYYVVARSVGNTGTGTYTLSIASSAPSTYFPQLIVQKE